MTSFLRLLLGLALLPACWAVTFVLADAILIATNSTAGCGVEAISFMSGFAVFTLAWFFLPRPVRAYVLAHELTHALWGLFFFARVSDVRVSLKGGSVKLSKTNLLITLAPYFFPFYTFLTVLAALGVYALARPLPGLPFWLFAVGLTWAFHIFFTLETLTHRQPDVMEYGRVFSWTFIFLVNILVILSALAAVTPLGFEELRNLLQVRCCDTYVTLGRTSWDILTRLRGIF